MYERNSEPYANKLKKASETCIIEMKKSLKEIPNQKAYNDKYEKIKNEKFYHIGYYGEAVDKYFIVLNEFCGQLYYNITSKEDKNEILKLFKEFDSMTEDIINDFEYDYAFPQYIIKAMENGNFKDKVKYLIPKIRKMTKKIIDIYEKHDVVFDTYSHDIQDKAREYQE